MIKEEKKFIDNNILEGIMSIKSLISAYEANINDRKILSVLIDSGRIHKKEREINYLKTKQNKLKFEIEFTDSETIDELTIGNSHGGIIAKCGDRTFPSLSDSSGQIKNQSFIVMLEGIEDPYNFGYALRSLYASGVDSIILSPRNWMGAAGVVCRASAGASELFPMYIMNDPDDIGIIKNNNFSIICADTKNAESIFDTALKYPIFLIIGGEKRGISNNLLNSADKIIKLEYGREFKPALSAATAASIIAYEIFRQNH